MADVAGPRVGSGRIPAIRDMSSFGRMITDPAPPGDGYHYSNAGRDFGGIGSLVNQDPQNWNERRAPREPYPYPLPPWRYYGAVRLVYRPGDSWGTCAAGHRSRNLQFVTEFEEGPEGESEWE